MQPTKAQYDEFIRRKLLLAYQSRFAALPVIAFWIVFTFYLVSLFTESNKLFGYFTITCERSQILLVTLGFLSFIVAIIAYKLFDVKLYRPMLMFSAFHADLQSARKQLDLILFFSICAAAAGWVGKDMLCGNFWLL